MHSTRRRRTTKQTGDDWSEPVGQGGYRLEVPIGTGASGIIYRASQANAPGHVAIKVLRPQYDGDVHMTRRLLHEASMAAAVRNPHVIEILDAGYSDTGKAFVAMELIVGRRLSELMDQSRSLELTLTIDIIAQLAEALRGTHQAGIFHGDVKPDNVLVCRRPGNNHFVKLIDFGVAGDIESSSTRHRYSMVCGTPSYMSPEQAAGETLDGRTDIYSLGVVMYEMLSGTTPIRGGHPRELLMRHRTAPPTPLRSNPRCAQLPPRIEAIVHRCLEKDPARRYQTAGDLLRELSFIQKRLQSVPLDTLKPPVSEVSGVRTTFAGLPRLTSFAAAAPANDPGQPLAALPLPVPSSVDRPGGRPVSNANQRAATSLPPAPLADDAKSQPTFVNRAAPRGSVHLSRKQPQIWASETREIRRSSNHSRWTRSLATLVLVALVFGYASASVATYLTTGSALPASQLGAMGR